MREYSKINKINYVLDWESIILKYINFTCFMTKTKITSNICSVANCLKYKYCKSNASTRYKA